MISPFLDGGGDWRNVDELFQAHAPRLIAFFARRLNGDMETARDLAGDVWLKVARRLAAGDEVPRPGLLYHIARANLTDYWRAQQRRATQALIGDEPAPDPIEGLAELADVRAALGRLDARARAILMSRFWLGLDRDETAARLGTTTIAAKSAQQRALAVLRRALEG